jgi:hypothetical protein
MSTDKQDPHYRLRVEDFEADRGIMSGLLSILEEDVTSSRPTAQVTNVRAAIDLTPEQAEWLHETLGVLLAAKKARDAAWAER